MQIKDKDRWKRLAALGAKEEIQTLEGQAKMSAVILQLVEPLIKQHGSSEDRVMAIIRLAVAGWNKSMFPPDKQPIIEKDLIDHFVPKDGSAEAVGMAVYVMDVVADRREKLFPSLRKIIVDYDVQIADGRLTMNVMSASIPKCS